MDHSGPSPSTRFSLTGRADWILIGLIGTCSLAAEGCAYLWGFYWAPGKWFFGVLGFHFIGFVLWVTLLFMPLIDPRQGRMALRLVCRAVLLVLAFGIWRLPFSLIQTPLYVQGCQEALQSRLKESDFEFIRRTIKDRLVTNPSLTLLQPEASDLPPAFLHLNRPLPNYIEIRESSADAAPEIIVEWGSSLVGRHGLIIDPLEKPQIGKNEDVHGVTRWYYEMTKGVYFYTSSD